MSKVKYCREFDCVEDDNNCKEACVKKFEGNLTTLTEQVSAMINVTKDEIMEKASVN